VDPVMRRSAAARVGFRRETARWWRDHQTVSTRTDEGTRDGAASLAIHLASPSARRVVLRSTAQFTRSRRRERESEKLGCSPRTSCDRRIVTVGHDQVGRRSGPGGRGTSRPRPRLRPGARERAVSEQAGPCWAASPKWTE
jgi:hypothetical protein